MAFSRIALGFECQLECRVSFIVMLNLVMLSVKGLSIQNTGIRPSELVTVMLRIVQLSVLAPERARMCWIHFSGF